jgi:hypothetical protein
MFSPSKKTFCPALMLLLLPAFTADGQTPPGRKVKASISLTGHYILRHEEFRNRLNVRQLPDGRIKFDLLALWVSYNNPENVHNGTLQGIVNPKNGAAIFHADSCKLTLEFLPAKIRITQSDDVGDCGFGANVTATGFYRKVDSRKPRVDF